MMVEAYSITFAECDLGENLAVTQACSCFKGLPIRSITA